MFLLGMFWKRTTGSAAVAGVIMGFVLSIFFNSFAVDVFGHETLLWTAYKNAGGVYEIPFLICMGWAFFFTMLLMIVMSLAGPKVNVKAFEVDTKMFRLEPSTIALIVLTLLCFTALYVKYW